MLSQSGVAISQRQRVNAFLKQTQKYRFTEELYSIENLLEKADARHFGEMQNRFICLHSILPTNNKFHRLFLRKRGHVYTLPQCIYNL